MPVQNALILAGIVSAFLIFGIVLALADFYSQRGQKQESKPKPVASPHQHLFDERRAA